MSATTTTPSLRPEQIRNSRVGKRPIDLPKGVTATVANGKIEVKDNTPKLLGKGVEIR